MYDCLLREAAQHNIDIYEMPLHHRTKGLYADNVIWINKNQTTAEKTCVLAEELGHYHTTVGDILDQSVPANRKQERRAREWAHQRLIPLERIVEAYRNKIAEQLELAEYFGVTEQFLQEAIQRYKDKYGLFAICNGCMIIFEPLIVIDPYE